MDSKSGPDQGLGEGYRYLALGATFAGGIVVFAVLGVLVDRWLGLTPLFTLIGTVLGSVLSFLNVYWKLQSSGNRDGSEGRDA
jgi:F0F1-type ATP synthase assembly protein I